MVASAVRSHPIHAPLLPMLGPQRSVCLLFQTSGRFRINNKEGTNRSLELMMRLLADPELHGEAVRYLGAAAEKELASHRAAAEVIGSHWGQATDCTAWAMDLYTTRPTVTRAAAWEGERRRRGQQYRLGVAAAAPKVCTQAAALMARYRRPALWQSSVGNIVWSILQCSTIAALLC
jgi:hypothetical protein